MQPVCSGFLESGLENLRMETYNICRQTIILPSAVHQKKKILCPIRSYFNLCPLFLCVIHHCEEPGSVLWAPAGCYFFPCLFFRLNQAKHPLHLFTKDKCSSSRHLGGFCWTPWTSSCFMVGLPVLCSSPMRLLGSTPLIAPYQLFMFTLISFHSGIIKENSLCQKPMADQTLTHTVPGGIWGQDTALHSAEALMPKGSQIPSCKNFFSHLKAKACHVTCTTPYSKAVSHNWEILSKEQY